MAVHLGNGFLTEGCDWEAGNLSEDCRISIAEIGPYYIDGDVDALTLLIVSRFLIENQVPHCYGVVR